MTEKVEQQNPFGKIKHQPGCEPPHSYSFNGDEYTGNQQSALGPQGDACGKGYVVCRNCGGEVQAHWSATGRYGNKTFADVQKLLENSGF